MKNEDVARYADMFAALGSEQRLQVMRLLLAAHPEGVLFNVLKDLCKLTDGNLSRHLQLLQESKLVEVWKGFKHNRPQTLDRMCNAWFASRPRVLLPTHNTKHGHPILLSCDGAGEILSLSPQRDTLKTYTSKLTEHTLELAIDDFGVLADIDTPADYQAAVDRTARE